MSQSIVMSIVENPYKLATTSQFGIDLTELESIKVEIFKTTHFSIGFVAGFEFKMKTPR